MEQKLPELNSPKSTGNEEGKTVYLLGAGASYASDFKFPLMEGFFKEEDFNSGNYPNLKKFIDKYFPSVGFSVLNLEQVITMLELSLDQFSNFGKIPESYLLDARREFERYVLKKLELSPKKNLCSKHSILANKIKKIDTIISLNYDVIMKIALKMNKETEDIVEETESIVYPLSKMRVRGDYGPIWTKEKRGYFLQLHGSVDWVYCPNPDCWLHLSFVPRESVYGYKETDLDEPCFYCGTQISSVIIPPSMNKSFQKYPRIGILWSIAYREILNANKLVFIGISMAESDYYLNWLIKSGVLNSKIKKSIEVVNRDKNICEKIKKLTGIEPDFLEDFDTYINKLKEYDKIL